LQPLKWKKKYPSFVTGLMILQGKKDIVLTLTFSKMAAARIVSSLLGIEYDQMAEAVVYDSVMEITNMVSGRLKTAIIATGEHYQLTTPFVFVGANHYLESQTRPNGIVKKFTDKHFEMLAGVFFL
jgi:CheY-specific phosphatase CheX